MAVIKVTDIAYVRLRSPDLDLQAEFLENFGLYPSEKSGKAIYYRGTDPVHHVHITEKGEPKFVGIKGKVGQVIVGTFTETDSNGLVSAPSQQSEPFTIVDTIAPDAPTAPGFAIVGQVEEERIGIRMLGHGKTGCSPQASGRGRCQDAKRHMRNATPETTKAPTDDERPTTDFSPRAPRAPLR